VSKTPVQTVRADFPHTAYQVVARITALRSPRILNRAAQAAESQSFDEGAVPDSGTSGAKPTTSALNEQRVEAVRDERVHLNEFRPALPVRSPSHEAAD
jgi:hypothetical protein